ncbi:MAG: anti-sigma factor family protein [Geminicoccaceae bacterium]
MARRSWKRRMQAVMFRMPMMITCREFETFIIAYFEGGLTKHQRRLFELHLKFCRECRDYLAAFKVTMDAAKQGLSEEQPAPPDDVPEDLIAAVIASRDTTE